MVQGLTVLYATENGLLKIRKKMNQGERKTAYYQDCLQTLQKEKPALVFCTNQRPASIDRFSAQDLGIPTAAFIFSWDNLPKATMVVETDYYFVWSEHMKKELFFYYPDIKNEQVFVTGTPQFEPILIKVSCFLEKIFLSKMVWIWVRSTFVILVMM